MTFDGRPEWRSLSTEFLPSLNWRNQSNTCVQPIASSPYACCNNWYVSVVVFPTCTNMSRLVANTSHPVNNHYNSNLDTFWTNLVCILSYWSSSEYLLLHLTFNTSAYLQKAVDASNRTGFHHFCISVCWMCFPWWNCCISVWWWVGIIVNTVDWGGVDEEVGVM